MSERNSRKAREEARRAARQAEQERREWFAPKRFGLGAGLPIRWQGWLSYALYLGVVAGVVTLERVEGPLPRPYGVALLLAATGVLIVIAARHTRGGWKWRWGKED